MNHDHDAQPSPQANAPLFWRSRYGLGLVVFGAIAAYFWRASTAPTSWVRWFGVPPGGHQREGVLALDVPAPQPGAIKPGSTGRANRLPG